MGRRKSARLPAARMSREMTTAKMGRSMKKRASFTSSSFPVAGRSGRFFHGGRSRIDLHARPDALEAIDDHAVAGGETAADHAQAVHDRPERHAAVLNRAVRRDDEDEPLVEIGPHRAVLNQQRPMRALAGKLQPHEETGYQAPIGVPDDGAATDAA